jgi:3-hydroxybutyryl-CoA dehydrogenase
MPGPVTVVGCGIMGSGITHVARTAGHPVTAVEASPGHVDAARERVTRYAAQAEKRGDGVANLADVTFTADLADAVAGAAVVIEAVPEDLELKRDVFATIGSAADDDAVLASNTSGLSIATLGEAAGRPGQMVGLHFFNPVPLMGLVEVARTPDTDDDVLARALEFSRGVGKETVEVNDSPGFVTTRLIIALMCEAIRAYEDGVATAENLDAAMKLGFNHPMGPLALADRVGLDTVLAIADDLHAAFGAAYDPPALLRKMVADGALGRKSGRGFYDYTG